MKFRIYAGTSVLGGCEDKEFAEHSVRLMGRFVRRKHILVLSSLTIQEVATSPAEVRKRVAAVPDSFIETLRLDAEANDLAEAYIAAGVLLGRMRADGRRDRLEHE